MVQMQIAVRNQNFFTNDSKRTSNLLAPTMMLQGHLGEIYTSQFSKDGTFLASAGFDRQIFLWNVFENCDNFSVLRGHKGAIMEIKFNSDSSHLVSGSTDKTCRVWDMETGACLRNFKSHQDFVNSVDVTRRGPEMICSASDDGTVMIHELRCKTPVKTCNNKCQQTAVVFNDTSDAVICGGIDNDLKDMGALQLQIQSTVDQKAQMELMKWQEVAKKLEQLARTYVSAITDTNSQVQMMNELESVAASSQSSAMSQPLAAMNAAAAAAAAMQPHMMMRNPMMNAMSAASPRVSKAGGPNGAMAQNGAMNGMHAMMAHQMQYAQMQAMMQAQMFQGVPMMGMPGMPMHPQMASECGCGCRSDAADYRSAANGSDRRHNAITKPIDIRRCKSNTNAINRLRHEFTSTHRIGDNKTGRRADANRSGRDGDCSSHAGV